MFGNLRATKKVTGLTLLATMALGLGSCGGITEQAKVATAVQTMMVLAVEAAVSYNMSAGDADAAISCSGGGEYTPSIDLQSLVTFIQGGADTGTLTGTFNFNECKMNLCGENLTLQGDAEFGLSGTLIGSNRQIRVDFASPGTNVFTSAGIINGADKVPAFKYTMKVNATAQGISDITIEDATPTPIPFEYKGKVYRAAELKDLAQGC